MCVCCVCVSRAITLRLIINNNKTSSEESVNIVVDDNESNSTVSVDTVLDDNNSNHSECQHWLMTRR